MRQSYLDYAMSVIVGRALPDVRDGLKPVHRRVLFSMSEQGNVWNRAYRKSARVVGDVMGKYHPHGDSAIYDTMVRMAQRFSLRYLLVDGQGNFGCFTGDTAIKLADGTEKTFAELAKLPPDEIFHVYAVDKTGKIVIAEGRYSRVTRPDAALMELTLDHGATIRCTPDHRFMLRDGSYKEAQALTPDDSLMPGVFDTAPVKPGLNDREKKNSDRRRINAETTERQRQRQATKKTIGGIKTIAASSRRACSRKRRIPTTSRSMSITISC